MYKDAIERIKQMEICFSLLQEVVKYNPAVLRENPLMAEMLAQLTEYYESGQWLLDYTLDEQNLLPPSLKRGVLAQDAVYDFLQQFSNPAEDDIS